MATLKCAAIRVGRMQYQQKNSSLFFLFFFVFVFCISEPGAGLEAWGLKRTSKPVSFDVHEKGR